MLSSIPRARVLRYQKPKAIQGLQWLNTIYMDFRFRIIYIIEDRGSLEAGSRRPPAACKRLENIELAAVTYNATPAES